MRRAEGWQIALVCGLILAGQPFVESCRIARVGHKTMKRSVPGDWTGRQNVRGKWRGKRLEALADDYRVHSLTEQAICERHTVSALSLKKLAQKYRWPKRPHKKWGVVSNMSPERQRLYAKLRIHLGIAEARKTAMAAVFPSAASPVLPTAALPVHSDGQGPAPFLPTETPALNSEAASETHHPRRPAADGNAAHP